jgi:Holliday junction resolvasome RuvABC endonuclease subunit
VIVEEVLPQMDTKLSVPVVPDAVTRIVGLDPSLSCGVSVLQLDSQHKVLSVDVGVIDISSKSLGTHGARCNELQRLLSPLLDPPPTSVYIESYYVHPFRDPKDGKWKVHQEGIDLNYKIRGALEMLLENLNLPFSYVAPQTWKSEVVGDGNAEKQVVKDFIERMMGMHFHPRLYSHDR